MAFEINEITYLLTLLWLFVYVHGQERQTIVHTVERSRAAQWITGKWWSIIVINRRRWQLSADSAAVYQPALLTIHWPIISSVF